MTIGHVQGRTYISPKKGVPTYTYLSTKYRDNRNKPIAHKPSAPQKLENRSTLYPQYFLSSHTLPVQP